MIKEAFGIADTIEEARELAAKELNADFDADINYEIVDVPKKKVMGLFGGSKAKVRAYIEIAEKKENKRSKPKKTEKVKAQKNEAKVKSQQAKAEPKERIESENDQSVEASKIPADSPAAKAVAYLLPILEGLGCSDVAVRVVLKEGGARIILTGEGLGACIGRRGETLDALQYLASMVASVGGYYRISLDVGNYREKRERTLTSLAHRISAQVKRTGRSRSLEPMNPYERRIIHTAVQEIEGVVSSSRGEGERRHVVISLEGGEKKFEKTSAPAREPRSDSGDLPLYGKIK